MHRGGYRAAVNIPRFMPLWDSGVSTPYIPAAITASTLQTSPESRGKKRQELDLRPPLF